MVSDHLVIGIDANEDIPALAQQQTFPSSCMKEAILTAIIVESACHAQSRNLQRQPIDGLLPGT
jgi:hypothetical protein